MDGYAPNQARDRSGDTIYDAPAPKPAIATTVGTPAASSVITLNPNTTQVEIAANGSFGASLAIKWGSASVIAAAGTANFDHTIPAGYWRRFVVPRSTIGVQSVVGLNVQNGLFPTMAIIQTSGSVISLIT